MTVDPIRFDEGRPGSVQGGRQGWTGPNVLLDSRCSIAVSLPRVEGASRVVAEGGPRKNVSDQRDGRNGKWRTGAVLCVGKFEQMKSKSSLDSRSDL